MTTFLRLLSAEDKAADLLAACGAFQAGVSDPRLFEVEPESFRALPGAPFAYWVSEEIRQLFQRLPAFHGNGVQAQHGGSSKDDFRFLRLYFEVPAGNAKWLAFSKGGTYSPFYSDTPLVINWKDDARELEQALLKKYPYLGATANWVLHRECFYHKPGITWPRRPSRRASFWILNEGSIFSENGPSAFVDGFDPQDTFSLLALVNSTAFNSLTQLLFSRGGAGSGQTMTYEVGYVGRTPVPILSTEQKALLATLARRSWALRRQQDSVEETSHAFILPASLRARLNDYDPEALESEISIIHSQIDAISFDLYGFSDADRAATQVGSVVNEVDVATRVGENEEEEEDEAEAAGTEPIDLRSGLLSWVVGVAFGRFDWRLAIGERSMPVEPAPFDPLPAKSPGMLPDGATPFHGHTGILVDDIGHSHDVVAIIEEVLTCVNEPVPGELRRWMQREFFPFHLQLYSKSRRKAPIYWPLSTTSGSYTLWVYYPGLTSQTLYTAINDFVEPKLKQVADDLVTLRAKGTARTGEDEKHFEALQSFELDLLELRDKLKEIAPCYRPNHDDGVQITAAPLWPLFRHKPWQKVLKETWTKLENGDFDWAHIALAYWPDRVREKCKTDKSLAIAHDLEDLYVAPEAAPKKTRGRRKAAESE